MSVAQTTIRIGSNSYRLTDLYGKTLFATKGIQVFNTFSGRVVSHSLKAGEPVGIVRGFVAKGYKSPKTGTVSPRDWLLVGPTNAQVKAVPYAPDNFSERQIREQGAKTVQEQVRRQEQLEQADQQPWYSKLTNTVAPWVIGGVVIYAVVQSKLKP
jgi:hypothetical protein